MSDFNGQVIAVIGATGGLGRALTEELRGRNATVVTVNRSGGTDVQLDLRDSAAGDALVEYVHVSSSPPRRRRRGGRHRRVR